MAKVIALAGVSGSGKTTFVEGLRQKLGDKCHVVDEVSKGEILQYCGLDFTEKFGIREQRKFDVGRVENQIVHEEREINVWWNSDVVIIDKAVPCSLLYMLTVASRNVPDDVINKLVSESLDHCNRMYDLIVYLPYANFNTKRDGLSRNFTNRYVLQVQDTCLHKILSWTGNEVMNLPAWSNDKRVSWIISKIETQVS